jgi:hypothetical protein
MDRDVVVDTVAELMETNGIFLEVRRDRGLGRAVIVKKIQMDKMSDQEARDAIQWEAGTHPFDIDDVS